MNDPTAMQYGKAIGMHKSYALQTESGSQYKMILAPKMLGQIPRNHYTEIHIWHTMNRLKRFGRSKVVVAAKASILAYVDAHPLSDFEPIGHLGMAWVGLHRQNSSRQFVMVQQCRQSILTGFRRNIQLAHLNIARPIALYSSSDEVHLAYEYLELELQDLLPLSDTEVASILSQVMAAIEYLVQQRVAFRIEAIRVSASGVVKIVPDWNFESTIDSTMWHANLAYVASHLESVATGLAVGNRLDPSFMEELKLGLLPSSDHPFISHLNDPVLLKDACRFALRKQLISARCCSAASSSLRMN
ncbi:hypothetical protein Purlil1_13550 [Purpureocillium lilacinum]|uniref:Protein kinase domain-containing protein n=1 Tax=Purpureocillium lilacinum TaxID=33203 RepID=A0ABR0BEG0_PURLI|nr:hypothetical protein Purlil1_13550 [Purpureocillium lilacinum]